MVHFQRTPKCGKNITLAANTQHMLLNKLTTTDYIAQDIPTTLMQGLQLPFQD